MLQSSSWVTKLSAGLTLTHQSFYFTEKPIAGPSSPDMASLMLSRGEESFPSASLSTLFLIQPRNLLDFFYARTLSWLMLNFLSTKNPRWFLKKCFLCSWWQPVILPQMQDCICFCWPLLILLAFGLICHLVVSRPKAHSMSIWYMVRVQLNQTQAPLLSSYGFITQQGKLYATYVMMKTGTWTLKVYLWE